MRRALLVAGLLLLLAVPAQAEDPVLAPEDRAEVVEALAEATEVQGICYGYSLDVSDDSDGGWGGRWTASNLGEDVDPRGDGRCRDSVFLSADISYTSDWSESEDSASWTLSSTVAGIETRDLKRLGLSSDALLDDGKAGTVLLNAVLALPVLVSDLGLAPPVTEDPTEVVAAPADARATNRPGSDWWRENGWPLGLLLLGIGLAALWASTTTPTGHRRAKAVYELLKD